MHVCLSHSLTISFTALACPCMVSAASSFVGAVSENNRDTCLRCASRGEKIHKPLAAELHTRTRAQLFVYMHKHILPATHSCKHCHWCREHHLQAVLPHHGYPPVTLSHPLLLLSSAWLVCQRNSGFAFSANHVVASHLPFVVEFKCLVLGSLCCYFFGR